MNYTTNAIYTYVKNRTDLTTRPVYCSSVKKRIEKKFPSALIHEIDRYEILNNMDFSYTDNHSRVVFEAQVFSNKTDGAEAEARSIMKDIKDAFRGLAFLCTSSVPTDNADESTFRLVSRFERIVGSNDQMPEEPDTDE